MFALLGWTKQVSRKDRKMKNKNDSGSEDKGFGSGDDWDVKQPEVVEEAPREQRKVKTKKKPAKVGYHTLQPS